MNKEDKFTCWGCGQKKLESELYEWSDQSICKGICKKCQEKGLGDIEPDKAILSKKYIEAVNKIKEEKYVSDSK